MILMDVCVMWPTFDGSSILDQDMGLNEIIAVICIKVVAVNDWLVNVDIHEVLEVGCKVVGTNFLNEIHDEV